MAETFVENEKLSCSLCDKDCLRRVAARLCLLDGCKQENIGSDGIDGGEADASNTTDHGDDSGCCSGKVKEKCQQEKSANMGSTVTNDCCLGLKYQFDSADGQNHVSANKNACSKNLLKAGSTVGGTEQNDEYYKTTQTNSCCTPNGLGHPGQSNNETGCCDTLSIPENNTEVTAAFSCCTTSTDMPQSSVKTDKCIDECNQNHVAVTNDSLAACMDHLQEAFKRYEALLSATKCICRTVADSFGVSCCALRPDGSISRGIGCAWSAKRAGYVKVKEDNHIDCEHAMSEKVPDHCHTKGSPEDTITGAENPEMIYDVEKSAAREHVLLNVSGMTCSGCSRKILRVLQRMDALSNVQVAFTLGMAEFDFDNKAGLIDEILEQTERETGFKISRITTGYQSLDVLATHVAAQRFERDPPTGVISMTKQKKNRYRIMYNPMTIGARSVLSPDIQLAPPMEDSSKTTGKRHLRLTMVNFVLAAAFTIPVVVLNWSQTHISYVNKQVISLVLATCVQGIAVSEFYIRAVKSLIYSRVIEMDMLVVISITAAYVYSVVAFALTQSGYHLEQEAFFETSSLLITLVLLGRLISAWARMRAISAVSVRSLQPETAILIPVEGGEASKIDARLLQFGDKIRVLPHSLIVTDGTVFSGESAVDESAVTGESIPVPKQANDTVIAGTINGSGTLDIQITRLPSDNSITDIANLVDKAIVSKPRVQDMADKVASWFIPAILTISLFVFIIWIAVAITVRNMDAGGAVGIAITYAIAVLAISCPCAIGLAVPMVIVIAGAVAARKGVIIKAADATERGLKVTDIVFDKTGTLTTGELKVVSVKMYYADGKERDKALAIARALAEGNDHPVSNAVAAYLAGKNVAKAVVERAHTIPGAGIEAMWEESMVKGGNPRWLGFGDDNDVTSIIDGGTTTFCLTVDGALVLAFGLESTLRDESTAVVTELYQRKITCHIVSGDETTVVQDVANTVGIESANTLARSSPSAKQQYIERLQSQGKIVLFCGDGTNDAAAVAQANIGVQMGSASHVTGAVADVVLLGGLNGLVSLLDLSRRSFRRIVFNFAWSAVYNAFAVLLASGVVVKFRIPPAYAGLGEIVSVTPVIAVAATLARRTS